MQSSKLIIILKALRAAEMAKLDKFLCHPYFADIKQKGKVLDLFQLLNKYFPKFNSPQLEKRLIYQQLFPDTEFSAVKMDKVMSRLLKMVKRFIAVEHSLRDETQLLLMQSRFFRERELAKPFQQAIAQLKKIQQNNTQKTQNVYFNNFLIEQELTEFESFYNKRRENLNLPNTLRNLDLFYLVTWLEYACRLLAQHRSNIPLDIQDQLMTPTQLSTMIDSNPHMQVPLVLAYHQAYLLLFQDDDPTAYSRLKQLLDTHASEFPFSKLQALQAICRNYCARQFNKGDQFYLIEFFELYKAHLEGGYLYYNEGIIPSAFKNLVTLGLKVKQFDWVKQFLDKHKNKIVGTTHPDDIYHFNLASYYFALQEYDKALDHLTTSYEDTYYKITARRLELKIYYEQKSVLLDSKIEAFKVYLFRISKKLLPALHRKGNNNFIDLLKQINHPSTFQNPPRIERLKERLEARDTTMDKQWLLEKLEELAASNR